MDWELAPAACFVHLINEDGGWGKRQVAEGAEASLLHQLQVDMEELHIIGIRDRGQLAAIQ